MAGRIAFMLAEGVAPRTIAAVTFTELAASELLSRVRDFVVELAGDHIPPELAVALPEGLSPLQKENLAKASAVLDEITCTTIYGFCQCPIKPYPAETNIDPGAGVTDRNQAHLIFKDITDAWLRERLSGEHDGILVEMVLHNPAGTVALIQNMPRTCAGVPHSPRLPPRPWAGLFKASADPPLISRRRGDVPAVGCGAIPFRIFIGVPYETAAMRTP